MEIWENRAQVSLFIPGGQSAMAAASPCPEGGRGEGEAVHARPTSPRERPAVLRRAASAALLPPACGVSASLYAARRNNVRFLCILGPWRSGRIVCPARPVVVLVRKPRTWYDRSTAVVLSYHTRGFFVPRTWFSNRYYVRPHGRPDSPPCRCAGNGRHAAPNGCNRARRKKERTRPHRDGFSLFRRARRRPSRGGKCLFGEGRGGLRRLRHFAAGDHFW